MQQPPFADQPHFGANPPFAGGLTQEQKVELLEYWRSILKRKWAILGLALGVALLAAVVAMSLTPQYRAGATLVIQAGNSKIVSIEDIYANASQQREHYQTQVEIMKSRDVAERTVRALKLYDHPLFDPRLGGPSWRQRAMAALGVGNAEIKSEWTEDELVDSAITPLMTSTTVTPIRLSQLVKVEFDSPDAALTARIANTLATEYIKADGEERYQMAQQASQKLQERLAELRDRMVASEKELQNYREKKGLVTIGGSAQTIASQQVAGMTERMLAARSKRMELESTYVQVKATTSGDFSSIPGIARETAVLDAQRQANAVKGKLAELLETLGTENQRVKQAQAELKDAIETLRQRESMAVASLTKEYESARNTEESLERALRSARGEAQDVNREEFQLALLEREYQSNRQLYEMFLGRAKETNLMSDIQASVARVVDKAITPTTPVAPKKVQIVLVALLLALFAGAAASITLDRLDNTVKGGDDAEIRLKQPVLATLPQVAHKTERASLVRLFVDEPHSHFTEGIRTARTGVMLSNLDVPHKTLLVTSTLPGEGKTTVAINLALAHAQTKRTLLIDCDMRRSQVSKALGLPPGALGITHLLAGTATADQCIHPIEGAGLMVMPVGDVPPSPLDLMLSQRFKDTLEDLRRQFEMVVIDSPPVELVSEALVLAPMATSTAMVVKAMSTPTPLVRKSLARLQRAGGHVLGVIVNHLDFKHAQRYYGEYGSSTYSYGSYGYAPQLGDGGVAAEAREGSAKVGSGVAG